MDKELYKLVVDEINVNIGDSIAYCDKRDCAKAVVEMLEDEGYRKADDDDIVLTKAMQDGSCEGMDDRTLEFFKKHNAAVRKETAKEILDKLLTVMPHGYEQVKAFVEVREEEYGVEVL